MICDPLMCYHGVIICDGNVMLIYILLYYHFQLNQIQLILQGYEKNISSNIE